MASKVIQTKELTIDLQSADGNYNRVIRITNPVDNLTRAQVVSALAPAVNSRESESSDAAIVPFFFDDYDPEKGLTVIGDIEIIAILKTITPIE